MLLPSILLMAGEVIDVAVGFVDREVALGYGIGADHDFADHPEDAAF